MKMLRLIMLLLVSGVSYADALPVPWLYESVSYKDVQFILMKYLLLYDLAERNNDKNIEEALRLDIESNAYYLIQVRSKQKRIDAISNKIDCSISRKIEKKIKEGKLFTGKQEFSYTPDQSKGLIPPNCPEKTTGK